MTYEQFKTHEMKKVAITLLAVIAIVLISLSVNAQPPQKHLPAKVTLTLNPNETIDFFNKLDSIKKAFVASSNFPSNNVQPFVDRFDRMVSFLTNQVQQQLISDTVKTERKPLPAVIKKP